MFRLIRDDSAQFDYPADVERLQKVLLAEGYVASQLECESLWQRFSDSMCAGWMRMDGASDEEVFNSVKSYLPD